MIDIVSEIKHQIIVGVFASGILSLVLWCIDLIRKNRAAKLMEKHARKNLKADYNYLDHASDNYQLAECKVIVDSEYHLPTVANPKRECVMVKSLFHNRMQEIVMDEKHFFHVCIFHSDLQTKEYLRQKWVSDPKVIDQPKDMNDLYPMVLGLNLSIVMYYKWRGTDYFVHRNNSFAIEHLLDCADVDSLFAEGGDISGYELEELVLEMIKKNGFRAKPANQYNGFTDIGVDKDELYLRLFYFVEIEKPAGGFVVSGKVKRIPRFIKTTPSISKSFKSSLVKLNLLCEGKVWE